ncbi:epoxide hydrolase family protein [Gordonia sp. NPDC003424]
MSEDRRVEPFTLHTEQSVIDDLGARLRATRWPDAPADCGWSLGTDLGYLTDLVHYWADEFDWYASESEFMRFPNLRIPVDGLGVHVIHATAATEPAMPLLLTHGWPDSCWRYLKVIPLLTDPAAHGADPVDAFDVIVPDMPGFGYSDTPAGAPLNTQQVAGMWAQLMTSLGYDRFVAAGGDMGSHVSRYLALDHPDRVIAVHRMDAGLPAPGADSADMTPEELEWLAGARTWASTEGAYLWMQSTKPQTAAFGLTDSPAGLAAWIVEKLRAWSDCDGDVERAFTRDEILTLVTQYWVTGTIGSSMRTYHANAGIPLDQRLRRVETPSGFSIFGGDVVRPPRAWLERSANTVYISEPPHGGHFAPVEVPEVYAEELRTFFRRFR